MNDLMLGFIIYGIIILPLMASLMAGGVYEDNKKRKVSKAKRSKRNLHRSDT